MRYVCLNDDSGQCDLCDKCVDEDGNIPDCSVECVICTEDKETCNHFRKPVIH